MHLTDVETVSAVMAGLSAFLIAYMEFRANRVTSHYESRITVLEHQVSVLQNELSKLAD